jgi:hypothetical protein
MEGHDRFRAHEHVHLHRLRLLVVVEAGAIEDEQQMVVVVVDLRPLAEAARVPEGQRMKPEQLAEGVDVCLAGCAEIKP